MVLQGGKELRGYPSFGQAQAGLGDGDVIEIRMDGLFNPENISGNHARDSEHALTIRAAPGYLPIVNSEWVCHSGDPLAVEGLEFQRALVYGGNIRITNCSFRDNKDSCSVQIYPVTDPGHRVEIVNCHFSESTFIELSGKEGQQVDIRNSYLESLTIACKQEGQVNVTLNNVAMLSNVILRGYAKCNVTAQGCRFAGLNTVQIWDQAALQWSGKNNVYLTRDHNSLNQFREQYNSPEDGSIQMEGAHFKPEYWRLHFNRQDSDSANNGTNFGANVDRVAR